MTNSAARIRSSLILLLVVILGCSFSHVNAQDPVVFIDKVETEMITPEKLGAPRSGSSGRPAKWVLVEFSYTVTPENRGEYLEEVQFKANIEGDAATKDDRKQQPVILTGEVTYMQVPAGKGFGSLYISPDVATRYHIEQNLSKFNVNVQAYVGGQMVDTKDKRKENDPNWFAPYKSISGLVMNKTQSVFILNDTDRYPTVKPKQGN